MAQDTFGDVLNGIKSYISRKADNAPQEIYLSLAFDRTLTAVTSVGKISGKDMAALRAVHQLASEKQNRLDRFCREMTEKCAPLLQGTAPARPENTSQEDRVRSMMGYPQLALSH